MLVVCAEGRGHIAHDNMLERDNTSQTTTAFLPRTLVLNACATSPSPWRVGSCAARRQPHARP